MSKLTRQRQPQILELCLAENPVLREKCRHLSKDEILSSKIQNLIEDISFTNQKRESGVGLSANQVGEPLAISVVGIKPTPARPNLEPFENVYINTEITETFGDLELMWEGCQNIVRDDEGLPLMAPVPRFAKIRIQYLDRNGKPCNEITEGFIAQVIQHETDHFNGILFTDKINVADLISNKEYREITKIP